MLPRKACRSGWAAVIALRALALALFIGAGSLAGCGDSGDAKSGDAFAEGDSSLTVALDPDGPDGPVGEMTEEVSCEDGTDDAACLAVRDVDVEALGPVSPETACTEQFGGPDTASLEGTIEGEALDVDLSRANGCEIERFDAAVPLLQALFADYEPGASIAE